jgi:hypothetical protein
MVACFFAGGAVTLAAACSRNARLDSSCRFSCSKSSMSRAAATLSTKTLQARVNGSTRSAPHAHKLSRGAPAPNPLPLSPVRYSLAAVNAAILAFAYFPHEVARAVVLGRLAAGCSNDVFLRDRKLLLARRHVPEQSVTKTA